MLLPALACFKDLAYLATELWQSGNHVFRLQLLKLLEIDLADFLVPQVDIRLDHLPFREHSGTHIIPFEDKHPPISASLRNNFALILNEAPKVRKPHLHPLVDNLTDGHQVLRDCRNV